MFYRSKNLFVVVCILILDYKHKQNIKQYHNHQLKLFKTVFILIIFLYFFTHVKEATKRWLKCGGGISSAGIYCAEIGNNQ